MCWQKGDLWDIKLRIWVLKPAILRLMIDEREPAACEAGNVARGDAGAGAQCSRRDQSVKSLDRIAGLAPRH